MEVYTSVFIEHVIVRFFDLFYKGLRLCVDLGGQHIEVEILDTVLLAEFQIDFYYLLVVVRVVFEPRSFSDPYSFSLEVLFMVVSIVGEDLSFGVYSQTACFENSVVFKRLIIAVVRHTEGYSFEVVLTHSEASFALVREVVFARLFVLFGV